MERRYLLSVWLDLPGFQPVVLSVSLSGIICSQAKEIGLSSCLTLTEVSQGATVGESEPSMRVAHEGMSHQPTLAFSVDSSTPKRTYLLQRICLVSLIQ